MSKQNKNGSGDDLIERLWANRQEEPPMSREQIVSALRPRVGRTTLTLKSILWTYLAALLATLLLQGVNLAGYRSNPTMLTVQVIVTVLAVGSTAFGIHLILLAGIGLAGAYGFYTVCAVLSIFFVIRMVHETRGIELEDMQG